MDSAYTTPPPFQVFPLLDGTVAVERLLSFASVDTVDEALLSLCTTIQSNTAWQSMPGVQLVARSHPSPLLAVFSPQSPGYSDQLETLRATLRELLERHTIIDYRDAEAAVERLAAILVSRFGRSEIRDWTFEAIPRGGVVVMGMLAYLLDLRPEQLVVAGTQERTADRTGTVCIVDDCSLSGIRFRELMNDRSSPWQIQSGQTGPRVRNRVIFCPLFAAEGLCEAIELAEPAVEACVCASVLEDLAPQRLGNAYPAWYASRRSMFPDAYWIGIPEYIAFAWHEPDSRAWNTETGVLEHGWYLAPTKRCLSTRLRLSAPGLREAGTNTPEELFGQEPVLLHGGNGPIRAADDVIWRPSGETLQLARLAPDAKGGTTTVDCFELSGSAAEMWNGFLEHGTVKGCVTEIVGRYGHDVSSIAEDVEILLSQLVEFGLLETQSQQKAANEAMNHSTEEGTAL